MRRPLKVQVQLFGTAFFAWLAYRCAPRELRPFMMLNTKMGELVAVAAKRGEWGVVTAAWSMGGDHNARLANEMGERVQNAAAAIRVRIERREFERALRGEAA